MAKRSVIKRPRREFVLRTAPPEFDELKKLAFLRYPHYEWATFARFGWRVVADGTLTVTLAAVDKPISGDLDDSVGHIAIDEQYTLRIALAAEKHPLAVGIIHSHPKNYQPRPSDIDDDMDTYYAKYFGDFAQGRPYVSLIISEVSGELVISGRLFWENEWFTLGRTIAAQEIIATWPDGYPPPIRVVHRDRAERFASTFGEEALRRMRDATVAIIGAGGTGSAAIEVLARAGVGRLIIIDPDNVERSNLERIHGSFPKHADRKVPKVLVAREHVRSIDPSVDVLAVTGRLPQSKIVDAIVSANVLLGCTDQQHSRLAISDLAFRYLIPSIDTGVMMEGHDGHVAGQIIQLVRFLPSDPCAICRGMINASQVNQELMSPEEQQQRQLAAKAGAARGEDPHPYWQNLPQLNTVGYLTTVVGALAAGYAIGWITGRFDPPFERLQMNLGAKFLDVTDSPEERRTDCVCGRARGWADQANVDAYISAPDHWPKPKTRS